MTTAAAEDAVGVGEVEAVVVVVPAAVAADAGVALVLALGAEDGAEDAIVVPDEGVGEDAAVMKIVGVARGGGRGAAVHRDAAERAESGQSGERRGDPGLGDAHVRVIEDVVLRPIEEVVQVVVHRRRIRAFEHLASERSSAEVYVLAKKKKKEGRGGVRTLLRSVLNQ